MHSSGAIHFDPAGDLWLSLGDNTDYKLSGGWAPINSKTAKGDARRTRSAASTLYRCCRVQNCLRLSNPHNLNTVECD